MKNLIKNLFKKSNKEVKLEKKLENLANDYEKGILNITELSSYREQIDVIKKTNTFKELSSDLVNLYRIKTNINNSFEKEVSDLIDFLIEVANKLNYADKEEEIGFVLGVLSVQIQIHAFTKLVEFILENKEEINSDITFKNTVYSKTTMEDISSIKEQLNFYIKNTENYFELKDKNEYLIKHQEKMIKLKQIKEMMNLK